LAPNVVLTLLSLKILGDLFLDLLLLGVENPDISKLLDIKEVFGDLLFDFYLFPLNLFSFLSSS